MLMNFFFLEYEFKQCVQFEKISKADVNATIDKK